VNTQNGVSGGTRTQNSLPSRPPKRSIVLGNSWLPIFFLHRQSNAHLGADRFTIHVLGVVTRIFRTSRISFVRPGSIEAKKASKFCVGLNQRRAATMAFSSRVNRYANLTLKACPALITGGSLNDARVCPDSMCTVARIERPLHVAVIDLGVVGSVT